MMGLDEPFLVCVKASSGPFLTTDDYVTAWWTAELGPTATCALQILSRPNFYADDRTWTLRELAQRLGIGKKPDQAERALRRLEQFRCVEWDGEYLVVWNRIGAISNSTARKLDGITEDEHEHWLSSALEPFG